MKKYLSLILVALMIFTMLPCEVMADENSMEQEEFADSVVLDSAVSGTCGSNVSWSFNTSTGALTISSTSNRSYMNDYYNNASAIPWHSVAVPV